ncbi:uncharacterized protein HMPREF1541_05420 [Cyphellophora europaea CBS 101466]|uniref:Uncharacterized protein n=1 Tax=Cyphellophora europaea (strain CBS 101466) TaxID=1220924 RepID=W2RRV8_CYPE1|nr:uncharacterized protein HMPREF1541_05420 [Cyphellophora europaea CBS 101466]ETN39197.1 hypothetical protein HMPREF1541_05420 [Cyphellophora europaea CBS 101466]
MGLSILSLSSARVLEQRQARPSCYYDPVFNGLWSNTQINADAQTFCASLLGKPTPSYCAGTITNTETFSAAITATVTVSTDTTVQATVTRTDTMVQMQLGKRAAAEAQITSANFLVRARDAIRRQAASSGATSADLYGKIYSACSCGNAAGSISLRAIPEICTTTEVKTEEGFATAEVFTATVTSGTTTVTVYENVTQIISTSRSATSFAPVPVTVTSETPEATTSADMVWPDWDFSSTRSSSTSEETTETSSSSTSEETTETSSSNTFDEPTTSTDMFWPDWEDVSASTTSSSTVTSLLPDSPTVQETTTSPSPSATSEVMDWPDWPDWSNVSSTTDGSSSTSLLPDSPTQQETTASPSQSTTSEGMEWPDWDMTTSSTSYEIEPTVYNTTKTTSASATATPTGCKNGDIFSENPDRCTVYEYVCGRDYGKEDVKSEQFWTPTAEKCSETCDYQNFADSETPCVGIVWKAGRCKLLKSTSTPVEDSTTVALLIKADPKCASTTSSSSSATGTPLVYPNTTTPAATTASTWGGWGDVKNFTSVYNSNTTTSFAVEPTIIETTTTTQPYYNTTASLTSSSVYPNITTSANITTSLTASPDYTSTTASLNMTTSSAYLAPNVTTPFTSSTACVAETVYLGNVTQTVTETATVVQYARGGHRWKGW